MPWRAASDVHRRFPVPPLFARETATSGESVPSLPSLCAWALLMIDERLKRRLKPGRPSTVITMRIPADVVEALNVVAPMRGFSSYRILLKSYISDGLRRDEAQSGRNATRRLVEALKRRGVAVTVLRAAMREVGRSY